MRLGRWHRCVLGTILPFPFLSHFVPQRTQLVGTDDSGFTRAFLVGTFLLASGLLSFDSRPVQQLGKIQRVSSDNFRHRGSWGSFGFGGRFGSGFGSWFGSWLGNRLRCRFWRRVRFSLLFELDLLELLPRLGSQF
ncbi:AAEL017044-PA [Aedes aegypti]|uniref:AAEL017044-PA n=1 Tax=Aedes aegypti TaxID=7159 RepID=J9EBT4_AEDAE|nr:AAEL017044-PA [Aedes aegypti]